MKTMSQTDPYFSRVSGAWGYGDRADPVLWGDGRGLLPAEHLQRFERDGFLFVDKLFSDDDVRAWRDEADRLANGGIDRAREEVVIEPNNDTVRSVFRVHRLSPVFKRLVKDHRLAGVARQILGSDVSVHQSRINYKRGFEGREFFWHSDFETWHMEDGMPRMRAVSAAIWLSDNNEFNGSLMVIPRSHELYIRCVGDTPENHYKVSLRQQSYGTPSYDALTMLVERGGIVAPKGPAGSVVFFDCNLMHGSAGNLSPYPRDNIFFVYNSVDNALVDPFAGIAPRPAFLGERDGTPVDLL
ncbi:MAG: ectoine hydroxylase [Planctomycetes bacterium]|nr:ectoine hydroxylase [Planctomycetota bacterium]NUQ34101.1 ectoine hydroxylase [Planctomycetaceae bacterium]